MAKGKGAPSPLTLKSVAGTPEHRIVRPIIYGRLVGDADLLRKGAGLDFAVECHLAEPGSSEDRVEAQQRFGWSNGHGNFHHWDVLCAPAGKGLVRRATESRP